MADPEDHLVDMALDVKLNGELMMSCGGRWNKRTKELESDASSCDSCVVVHMHPGQRKATEWFHAWMVAHVDRRDAPPLDSELEDCDEIDTDPTKVYSALMAGGRRGGKTWWAAVACVAYAVQFPGAIVWCVSPSRGRDDTKADEIRRYMVALIAPEWVKRQTVATGWELINGSEIKLKSAHVGADPDAIKEGEANLIWLNEAQKMVKRVYVVARGAVSDRSGLVLCCANPPVEAKDQQWVSDFAADTDALRRASIHINFNPLDNPHVDRRALLSMAAELDERSFQIEVLGMFMPAVDAVAYNWLRRENEMARPDPQRLPGGGQRECARTGLIDVTAEFLEREEEGEGIEQLIGLDVQRIPYIGGPVYRFYAPPTIRPDRDNVLAWIVGEEILPGGDELEWCHKLHEHNFDPRRTLIVCDGTGQYQHSRRRDTDSPPPEWKGRGSFDLIRGEGFTHIVPPSRRLERKNPEIVDRIRAFTSMIANKLGTRRLFADHDSAPLCCQAIREWKVVNGKPSRTMDVCHLGDGISYPLIRLFPRILRSGKPSHMAPGAPDPVVSRVDRPDPGDRFFRPRQQPRGGHRAPKNWGL